ncbi:MAG: hypothetical protein MUF40_00470 [Gemmatimonadaceae bacterium]|nr:hypothetical protein [Gemmatimonadaceae bacterium]
MFRRLLLLALLGGVAYATRDRWLPLVRADQDDRGRAAARDSVAAAADTGWAPVTYAATARARAAVTTLRGRRGPAYVHVAPAAFAGLVLDTLGARLPASADSLTVRVAGRELQVRMSVRLGDLGGQRVLGPLAGMLGDRERLVLGGTLEGSAPGTAVLRIARARIGRLAVPGPVVPQLVDALRRGDATTRPEPGALVLTLPDGVGDVRVADGRITLYRPIP